MEVVDEVMCLLKALQSGVSFRSCSWKPSGQPGLSHTKHTHDPVYLTSFLLVSNLTFCPLFFLSLVSPPLSPLYHFTSVTPLLSFKYALSKKISYSLMHGSCREQCYLIFPWQPSLCFRDPITVLVATCSFASTEHIYVLNRRNYCKIPKIE